jgi:hypothetical protein
VDGIKSRESEELNILVRVVSFFTHTEEHMMRFVLTLLLVCGINESALAEKILAGPKGGRLLEAEGLKAEFFVEKDHTINISFYDEGLKKVPAESQVVTATAEAPSGKTKLEFQKKGDDLVSSTPLPDGHGYTVVVQIKQNIEAKPKNFRIPLDTTTCGGCGRAEYACTCDEG